MNAQNQRPWAFQDLVKVTVRAVSALVYPPSCVVCAARLPLATIMKVTDSPHIVPMCVCHACLPPHFHQFAHVAQFDENCFPCRVCGELSFDNQTSDSLLCLSCDIDPLPFRTLGSVWFLSRETRNLISALKYRGQLSIANYFGVQLAHLVQQSNDMGVLPYDCIVAVPSGTQTLRQRGYSHTALIASALGKHINLPVKLLGLNATGSRPRQTGLLLRERRQNIHNAFYASASHVAGRNILLVDDVVTSGSSLLEATNTLLNSGAKNVSAVTLARSRHFRRYRLVLAQQKLRARKSRHQSSWLQT